MEDLAGLRIAAYARFSSDAQRDTSIDDQVNLVRQYVTKNGGTLTQAATFFDYATSGTVLQRAGFDALLRLVETRAVDLVVTESGDRLTRDLGDADRLWKQCEYNGVRLIAISDGIDSARDGSRMAFRFKAIMSDEYVRDLAAKTVRGMKGQFSRAYATGGLAIGYASVPVSNGSRDPIGYEVVIDQDKAAIVKRIFELYVSGESLLSICTILNGEGVPTPRATSKSATPKYWRKNTVSSILSNRTYIGEFTFGKKLWRKDPATRKRRYIARPADSVLVDQRPHLAIIPVELFEAANRRKRSISDRKVSGRKTAHAFSGLLYCVCGSKMTFAGGSTQIYYACNAAHSGGSCVVKQSLREDMLMSAAFEELRRVLSSEGVWKTIQAELDAEIANHARTVESDTKRIEGELLKCNSEIQRFVRFIASTDDPSVAATIEKPLSAATQRKRELEQQLLALPKEAPAPGNVPTREQAIALAMDLEANVRHDPTGFRELLRSHFLVDGRIVMEGQPDGSWRALSAILPLTIEARPRKRNGPDSARESGPSSELVTVGCGGRI